MSYHDVSKAAQEAHSLANSTFQTQIWESIEPFGAQSQYSEYSPTISDCSESPPMHQPILQPDLFKVQDGWQQTKLHPFGVSTTIFPSFSSQTTPIAGILKHSKTPQKHSKSVRIQEDPTQPHSNYPSPTPASFPPPTNKRDEMSQLQMTNTRLIENYSALYKKYLQLQSKDSCAALQANEVTDEEKFCNFFKERVHQICSFQLQTGLSRLKSTLPSLSIASSCMHQYK